MIWDFLPYGPFDSWPAFEPFLEASCLATAPFFYAIIDSVSDQPVGMANYLRITPAHGVIACQGGNMAGWSVYLDTEGVATYVYNLFGHVMTTVRDHQPLSAGRHVLRLRYDHDGGFGAGGDLTFAVDDVEVDQARLNRTVPIIFSMSGETFDVGIDTGAPVGPYPPGFPCSAEIIGVTL